MQRHPLIDTGLPVPDYYGESARDQRPQADAEEEASPSPPFTPPQTGQPQTAE